MKKKLNITFMELKYSKEEHKDRIRQQTGGFAIWYKKPAPKGTTL